MKDKCLRNLFLIFAIIVFFFALYYSVFTLLTNYYINKIVVTNLLIWFLIIFIFYFIVNKLNLTYKKTIIILFIIFSLGVGLRIASINFFETAQISDFANPNRTYEYLQENNFEYHENTLDNNHLQNNFAQFPTWYVYSSIIVNFYNIFGYNPEYVKILNVFLYIFTSIFLYFGVKNMFSKKIGLLSAFILAICPSIIIYTNISTPDHFTILLMALIIFIWSIILQNKINIKKKYLYTFVMIIFMIVINFFKPLSIYMLLVFLCTELIVSVSEYKNIKKYVKDNWKYVLFFCTCFIFMSFVGNTFIKVYTENGIKMTIKDSSSLYLLWGYSVDENGEYNSNYIYTEAIKNLLKKYNNDYDKVFAEMKIIALDNFKKNIKYLPNIWKAKFKIAFSNESDYYSFANTGPDSESKNYYNENLSLSNSFMGINYLMIILVCIGIMKNKIKEKETIIILLMICGFIAIIILGGVQSRYKSLITPQFMILFALGVDYLYSKLRNFKVKLKKEEGSVILSVGLNNNSGI